MRLKNQGRTALAVAVAIACGGLVACGSDDSSESGSGGLGGTVAINQSGGPVAEVYEKVWFSPLEEKTGLSVRDSAPADFTKLKAQVDSGNVIWDVAEIETGGQYLQAVKEGLVEKIDQAKLRKYMKQFGSGNPSDFLDGTFEDHAVWLNPFATILVYDKREFPDSGPQPDSLDALWDFKRFPGKRCIANSAVYNLEIGLRADGVSKDDMYPLDVDRALDKFDELKPEVAKFWREGAEPIQLVSNGECVMSTVWNGRPFAAEVLEGVDYLGVAWDGGTFMTSRWVIPKGAPNLEASYAALGYFLRPSIGIAMGNELGYPNTNTTVTKDLDPRARKFVVSNPANYEGLTVQDDQWWTDNGEEAEEKFVEWMAD